MEERNVNVAYSMDLSGLTGEEGDVSSTLQILLEERRLIDGRAAFISAVDVNPGEIVTVDDIIVVAILLADSQKARLFLSSSTTIT